MLFEISDITLHVAKKNTASGSVKIDATPSPRLLSSMQSLSYTIGELKQGQVIPFMTHGAWSLHQLLEFLLLQIGPSKVMFTTWTITEDPIRAILSMIDRNLITELNAIFDYRIEKRKPEAFQLANNIVTRIGLTKCHAKVMVLQNDTWNVTVIGSSNFSKNPRIESGVIFTDRETADFTSKWIIDELKNKEEKC